MRVTSISRRSHPPNIFKFQSLQVSKYVLSSVRRILSRWLGSCWQVLLTHCSTSYTNKNKRCLLLLSCFFHATSNTVRTEEHVFWSQAAAHHHQPETRVLTSFLWSITPVHSPLLVYYTWMRLIILLSAGFHFATTDPFLHLHPPLWVRWGLQGTTNKTLDKSIGTDS